MVKKKNKKAKTADKKNFVKIKNGEVIQKQPYFEEGYIEAPLNVSCGFFYSEKSGEFLAPPITVTWAEIRYKRDTKLIKTDWTQLADIDLAIQKKYAEYRQKLRDLPQSFDSPEKAEFPKEPN